MRILLLAFLTLALKTTIAQITIDNTTYTPTQLVDGVLIPVGSGTVISNVQFSGVYNVSNRYQIGHFSTTGSTLTGMGISSGVVLSTGNTSDIPLALGTNPGAALQMSTGFTSCTAGEIRETGTCPTIINDVNILAGSSNYFNAAILEFDFVPVSSMVEFKYMFGSEEYQDNGGLINYQCSSFNDKFGFLISGPGIAGAAGYSNSAVNIALLANGSEVGINSVNNGVVGSGAGAPSAAKCTAANPAWVQNAPTAEFLGTIDGTELNGNTIVLTASRTGLTPGQTYHIRLIVTDVNDAAYDAVVYLEAGSFTTQAPCTPPANPTATVTTQPDCNTTTGTISVTAPVGANIQYSVNGTNYQTSGTFTGLAPGNYNVTAQDMSTNCVSASTPLTVNSVPGAPAAPTATVTTQPDCITTTGTITVTAPVGANIQYSVNGTNYQTSGTFTGLAPGNYNVTAQNTTTGCVSASTPLTVNPLPIGPAAPTATVTTQPDCITTTGTITVTAPVGANIQYSVNGTNYQTSGTFTGLAPGNYNVTAQNTTTGCVSAITLLTVNSVPGAPATPTATVTTQPDCITTTGTITVTAPVGANIQYSVNGTNYQTSGTFTGLASGNYNVTAQNTTTGCVSASTPLTVNSVPGAPATPTATVTTQPDCITTTGTITVTAPVGANIQYSVNGTTYQTSGTFTGLASGNYNVTAQNTTTGCVSAITALTVNPIPSAPTAPTASVTAQPDCTTPTGTITVTAPSGATIEYSVDGLNYQTSGTFAGLLPGVYTVTALDQSTGCESGGISLTVNPALGTPATPTASATAQPNCITTTGTITVTAPSGATIEYSIDGVNYQASPVFTNLPSGSYTVTVQDAASGCISSGTTVIINPIPANPATPTATVSAQPDCAISTGTIAVTAPVGATIEYSIDGVNYQSSGTFVGVVSGNYTITAQDNSTGCISGSTNLTVNAPPTAQDCEPFTCGDLFIPTAFSPNGDSNNDAFKIMIEKECVTSMTLRVFDRWGELIFETTDSETAWDGTYKGSKLKTDVYVYTLVIQLTNASEETTYSGNLTLFN